MHLIFRPARLGDLPTCLACARDRSVFDRPHQRLRLDMWRDLVAAGTAGFWVMEDLWSLDPACGSAGRRKRRLLHYLRHHLEELRPSLPPGSNGGGSQKSATQRR